MRANVSPLNAGPILKGFTYAIILLWLGLQVALLAYFWDTPQTSDPANYMRIANRCFEAGQWYPYADSVYSPYIWNPGFINFLILQLKAFGTLQFNAIFNIAMNLGIVFELFFLARKFFSERVGYFSVILYCLLYSNLMVVLNTSSEVPFLFLALSALCLATLRQYRWLILSGIIIALANWVRPAMIFFAPAILMLFLREKRSLMAYLALIVPAVAATFIIGKTAEARMGYFITQSTTTPLNLIMTANDKAYGGVATSIFSDKNSTAYIENESELTFEERGKIWQARSLAWIKENPKRYAVLYLKKIAGLYVEDSWADRSILGTSGFVDAFVLQKKVSTGEFVFTVALMCLKSLTYYLVLLLFAYFLFSRWHSLGFGSYYLLSIIAVGTAITCLFCVSPRYHYPFFFAIVILAACGLEQFLLRKHERSNKKLAV